MDRVVKVDGESLEFLESGELAFFPAPVGDFLNGAEAVLRVVEPSIPLLVLPLEGRVEFAMAAMDVVVGERQRSAVLGFCHGGASVHGALDSGHLAFFITAEQGKERGEGSNSGNLLLQILEAL